MLQLFQKVVKDRIKSEGRTDGKQLIRECRREKGGSPFIFSRLKVVTL